MENRHIEGIDDLRKVYGDAAADAILLLTAAFVERRVFEINNETFDGVNITFERKWSHYVRDINRVSDRTHAGIRLENEHTLKIYFYTGDGIFSVVLPMDRQLPTDGTVPTFHARLNRVTVPWDGVKAFRVDAVATDPMIITGSASITEEFAALANNSSVPDMPLNTGEGNMKECDYLISQLLLQAEETILDNDPELDNAVPYAPFALRIAARVLAEVPMSMYPKLVPSLYDHILCMNQGAYSDDAMDEVALTVMTSWLSDPDVHTQLTGTSLHEYNAIELALTRLSAGVEREKEPRKAQAYGQIATASGSKPRAAIIEFEATVKDALNKLANEFARPINAAEMQDASEHIETLVNFVRS